MSPANDVRGRNLRIKRESCWSATRRSEAPKTPDEAAVPGRFHKRWEARRVDCTRDSWSACHAEGAENSETKRVYELVVKRLKPSSS